MFDTVIINGKIIDGTGNPWIAADVGIAEGKITKVGPIGKVEARQIIDARGRFVCPGFVDGHSHSELFILAEPDARQKVMQGITTENLGMDGMSVAPILEKDIPGWRRHLAGLAGDHDALTRDALRRFWNRENWAIYPDVIHAIERLRAGKIRIGILSNASSDLVGFLEEIGLLPYFDFTLVSTIVGTKKPDRRIFECALDLAGVEAAHAAHVGDMYLEDILGARNVGVRPFLIDRGRKSLFPSFPEAAEHSPDEVEIVRGLEPMLDALDVE